MAPEKQKCFGFAFCVRFCGRRKEKGGMEMLGCVFSGTLRGVEGYMVRVEADQCISQHSRLQCCRGPDRCIPQRCFPQASDHSVADFRPGDTDLSGNGIFEAAFCSGRNRGSCDAGDLLCSDLQDFQAGF